MTHPPSSSGGDDIHADELIRVGVDASHRRTGWAIAIGPRIINYGTHHVDLTAAIKDRREYWRELRDTLRSIERTQRRDVYAIGIEAPWLGPNRQGSLQHARVVGMHEALANASFPYAEQHLVQPQSWRSACGLPRTGKEAPRAYAEAVLRGSSTSAERLDQDAADAICIVRSLYIRDAQENATA